MRRLRRLVGLKRKRIFLLDPKRVACFELRAKVVYAVMVDGETFTTNYKLRELEGRLAPLDFTRIHRDVLVNLNSVTEIETLGQGRLRLVLNLPTNNGEFKAVTVSRLPRFGCESSCGSDEFGSAGLTEYQPCVNPQLQRPIFPCLRPRLCIGWFYGLPKFPHLSPGASKWGAGGCCEEVARARRDDVGLAGARQ